MRPERFASNFLSMSASVFTVTNAFFSIIVVYFVYLYSAAQQGVGWSLLNFLAKWYLIIILVVFGLFVLLMLIFLVASLMVVVGFMFNRR